MAMKQCPDCGEKYSDTYRRCPFCAEEAAMAKNGRRKGGHRAGNDGPSVLSSLLVLVIVILSLILVGTLFGDSIREFFGGTAKADPPAASSPAISAEKPTVSQPEPTQSEEPSGEDQPQEPDPIDISALPETLKLSATDFTMKVGDTPVKLTVSGGSGSYIWSSEDEGIASVTADGTVVAVSAGSVKVTASDGSAKGTCIVRVKGDGVPNTGNTSAGTAKLNREDITLKTGESFRLQLSGSVSTVSWSSGNSAVASVGADGTVTGVAPGSTTVTASWGDGSASCVIRVR